MTQIESGSKSKNFFGRHSRLISFIGALIVFMTFVIKDSMRENLKDLVSSIDNAQTVYTLREDIGQASRERYLAKIDDVEQPSSSTQGSGDRTLDIKAQISVTRSTLKDAKVTLDRSVRLAEKLTISDSLKWEMKNAQDRTNIYLEDVEGVRECVLFKRGVCTNETVNEKIMDLSGYASSVRDTASAAASQIVDQAEATRVDREREYRWSTWASFALYTIGWGLGLAGRLYGGVELLPGD